MKILVIGAGIVGLATAYLLRRNGYDVEIVDSGAHAGTGTSAANGAQLSYRYVQPMADPSIWLALPKLLLSKDSPLKWRPSSDWAQLRWLAQFLAACTAQRSAETTRALLALGALSRAEFDQFRQEEAIDCAYAQNGKLVVYRSSEALSAAAKQVALQANLQETNDLQTPQEICSAERVFSLEPALQDRTIVGGIYTSSECVVDCAALCRALAAKNGNIRFGETVRSFEVSADRVTAAITNKANRIACDAVVLCTGAQANQVLSTMNLPMPIYPLIYPLKGYSITLHDDDLLNKTQLPSLSVTDAAKKVVFAPLSFSNEEKPKRRLRVAGFAELVGYDLSIPQDRIASLLASTEMNFGLKVNPVNANISPWAGLRPATPTGLPILGNVKGLPTNLFCNLGHGALGLTLAFGSARRIADMIADRIA